MTARDPARPADPAAARLWTLRPPSPWTAAATGSALVTLWSARHFFHDDAFITFRYVDRLWAGRGLSWTAGPPVEGFTHPFWLALLALARPLPVSLPHLAQALGVVFLAGVFAVWARARLAPEMLLVSVSFPGLVLWTLGGLETTMFCFFLLFGFVESSLLLAQRVDARRRGPVVMALAFAAAGLTRPEGVACGVLAIGFLFACGRRSEATRALLPFAAPIAAYALFRLIWFGDLIPNSARVKVFAIDPGIQLLSARDYLLSGLSRFHAFRPELGLPAPPFGLSRFGISEWVPPVALSVAAVLVRPSRTRLLGLLLALPVAASAVSGGGDHMRGMRLLVPAVLISLAGAASPAAGGAPNGRTFRILAIVTASWNLLFSTAWNAPNDQAASVGAQVGRFLESRLPAGSVVATATAGSTPFFAPSLDFIDTLGLNDRVIARRAVTSLRTAWQAAPGHRKGDGAYVLDRKPDLVVVGPAQGTRADGPVRQWFLTDLELSESARFREEYRPVEVLVPIDRSLAAALRLPPAYEVRGTVPCVFYLRRGSVSEEALVPFASGGT